VGDITSKKAAGRRHIVRATRRKPHIPENAIHLGIEPGRIDVGPGGEGGSQHGQEPVSPQHVIR
jgi:hypothetical protein